MKPPKSSEAATTCNMAIHACLSALGDQLAQATTLAEDASNAMGRHERHLAIGTMMPLEQILPECDALARAVRTLQTWHNRLPHDADSAANGGAA